MSSSFLWMVCQGNAFSLVSFVLHFLAQADIQLSPTICRMCLFFTAWVGFFWLVPLIFWPGYILHFRVLFVATSDVGIPWDWFVLLGELPSLDEDYKSHL